MKYGKKLLSLMLCLLLAVSLLPVSALAEESEGAEEVTPAEEVTIEEETMSAEAAEELTEDEPVEEARFLAASGTCGDNLTWTLSSTGTLTIKGSGEMMDCWDEDNPWYEYCDIIKKVVINSGVTSIGADAFDGCSSLTSISIPDSVTSIGEWAFYDCSSLTSISIPEGLTSIGNWAFYGCSSLTSISIPSGVTNIGNGAFSGCSSLTSISVASGNTAYASKDGILYNKAMTELIICPISKAGTVSIPGSVSDIEQNAFSGCNRLTGFSVASANTAYASKDGILYNKEKTELIKCPAGKAGTVTIPAGVRLIDYAAFYGCKGLTAVGISNDVAGIYGGAFLGCSGLTSISIPDSVDFIGYNAFQDCSGLTCISIGSGVTCIQEAAFDGCGSLTDVYYAGTEEQWWEIGISMGNDPLEGAAIHYSSSSVTVGDVDGSGKVNLTDVSRLYRCLTVTAAGMNPYAADVTGDGMVTIRDVAALFKLCRK